MVNGRMASSLRRVMKSPASIPPKFIGVLVSWTTFPAIYDSPFTINLLKSPSPLRFSDQVKNQLQSL